MAIWLLERVESSIMASFTCLAFCGVCYLGHLSFLHIALSAHSTVQNQSKASLISRSWRNSPPSPPYVKSGNITLQKGMNTVMLSLLEAWFILNTFHAFCSSISVQYFIRMPVRSKAGETRGRGQELWQ